MAPGLGRAAPPQPDEPQARRLVFGPFGRAPAHLVRFSGLALKFYWSIAGWAGRGAGRVLGSWGRDVTLQHVPLLLISPPNYVILPSTA